MSTIEFHQIGLLTEEPHDGEFAYPSIKLAGRRGQGYWKLRFPRPHLPGNT